MLAIISEICIAIIGIYMAASPVKYVEGMNSKRVSKGKEPFSAEETAKKVKTIRIIGIIAVLVAIALFASDVKDAMEILSQAS